MPSSRTKRRSRTTPRPGQLDLRRRPVSALYLDDKIPKEVNVLIVGVNPGIRSAQIGHYFAGHSNYFWKLLYACGIWPSHLTTLQDDEVVKAGFGFTDMSKRPTAGTGNLTRADFAASEDRIRRLVDKHRPRLVVFVSRTAYRAFLGKPQAKVAYGLQTIRIGNTEVFVVPSTSGASMADSSYRTKLRWFSKLRELMEEREIHRPT